LNSDSTTAEDQSLLRRFASTRDEGAFRELVEKYTSLVFGVAMRRTGQRDAAEEIVQTVFLVLARKAGSLGGQRSLGAWLHRTATFESLKSLRQDSTRQRHLDMIRDHQKTHLADDDALWKEVRPLLDQLLDKLPTSDREILVAHYFEGRQFAEIANRIGLTAAAAQKRGSRALKKLAGLLGKRGIVVPVAVLASGLGVELAHAVPVGLAAKIGTSVLGSTLTTASAGVSASSIITAMTTSKLAFAATFLIAASLPVGVHYAKSATAKTQEKSVHTGIAGSAEPAELQAGTKADAKKWAFDANEFRESLRRLIAGGTVDMREVQRQLLTLNLDEVQSAIAVLDEFQPPDTDRLHELMQFAYVRWAELDPSAATGDAGSRPTSPWGYYPLHGAWDTWAFSDWDSARVWARETQTEFDHSFLYWGYLDTMGAIDGELTVARSYEIGEDLPKLRDQFLTRAMRVWATNEPENAIPWMDENLTEPLLRDHVIGEALESYGERQPADALDQVAELIGNVERQSGVRYNIYWMWALQQPLAAADYLETSGGEGWNENTLRSAGEAIARNEPERAIEVSRTISDAEGRDSFYVGILGGASESDFSLVIEAADHLSSSGARTNGSLRYFLEDWAGRDRRAARAWVDALPEGQKKRDAQHMFPRN